MSAPQSTEQWKLSKDAPQYCAVVFQPHSINNLYCLMNQNLLMLMYDLIHYTAGEYVDSYIVGVPMDESHFDNTLDELYDDANQQPNRSTYWQLQEDSDAEASYQETLELWKRLASQIEPRVSLQINGFQNFINPGDTEVQKAYGSNVLNLSSNPGPKLDNPQDDSF